MGRDESFAEYVELRWSPLSRLAVLLVGEADAEELARAALLRAYDDWTDVLEAGSPHQVVTECLIDQLRAGIDEGRWASPASAGDDELWSRFVTLPPLQRAVVVLRWYDGLPGAEPVRMLGLDLDEETSLVAEAMARLRTDPPSPHPPDLTAMLRRRAADFLPTLPPVEELLRAGHAVRTRRTRRRALITAVVVAALAGASALVAATDPGQRPAADTPARRGLPSTMDQVPAGTPPRAQYAVGRTLDFGPATVELPEPPSALAKAGSDIVVSYPGGRIELFDPATESLTTLTEVSAGTPVVDADGHWVAWRRDVSGPVVVVAASLTGAGRHEQTFPVPPACCASSFELNGITRSGQLIATVPVTHQTWAWDLGTARTGPHETAGVVLRLQGLSGLAVAQVSGDDVATTDASSPATRTTVGTVVDHTFRPTFSTDRQQADFIVPGWIIYTARDGTLRSRRLPWAAAAPSGQQAGQPEVLLRLPAHLTRLATRRELGTTVVMDVRPRGVTTDGGFLVRCDIATGSCQSVARIDAEHHLVR